MFFTGEPSLRRRDPLAFAPPTTRIRRMLGSVRRASSSSSRTRARSSCDDLPRPSWTEGTGTHRGLPGSVPARPRRVRSLRARGRDQIQRPVPRSAARSYWQAWSEPNLFYLINPQRVNNRPVSPSLYRRWSTRLRPASTQSIATTSLSPEDSRPSKPSPETERPA